MAEEDGMAEPLVGMIGLGSMGGCLAERLLAAGRAVIGYDPGERARDRFVAAGGTPADDPASVATQAGLLILALPTVEAFRAVIGSIASAPKEGWIVDLDTLLPEEKAAARDRLAPAGWTLLDATVSGTPEMVAANTHSLYISGDGRDAQEVRALLAALGPTVFDMGAFGNAAAIKLIINHMVIAHNVVAAEAMSLAIHAGMDPLRVYETVAASAGNSRIFELRGRMMAHDAYPDADMYALIVDKDARLIADLARDLRHPVPMLAAAVQQHVLAMAEGWAGKDPASLCAMMEKQVGAVRRAG